MPLKRKDVIPCGWKDKNLPEKYKGSKGQQGCGTPRRTVTERARTFQNLYENRGGDEGTPKRSNIMRGKTKEKRRVFESVIPWLYPQVKGGRKKQRNQRLIKHEVEEI